jgi:hypothetical protein
VAFGKRKTVPIDPEVMEKQEVAAAFAKGVTALRDFIAPSSLKFEGNYFQLGTRFARTYYVYG